MAHKLVDTYNGELLSIVSDLIKLMPESTEAHTARTKIRAASSELPMLLFEETGKYLLELRDIIFHDNPDVIIAYFDKDGVMDDGIEMLGKEEKELALSLTTTVRSVFERASRDVKLNYIDRIAGLLDIYLDYLQRCHVAN